VMVSTEIMASRAFIGLLARRGDTDLSTPECRCPQSWHGSESRL
jgi:hypothetical protein